MPVARAPAAVRNGDDLDADGRLPKNDYERKAPQHHSARAGIVCSKPLRISGDLIQRGLNLVQKTASSSAAGCIHRPQRSTIQPITETLTSRAPREDLLQAKLNLLPPGFFGAFLYRLVQAVN